MQTSVVILEVLALVWVLSVAKQLLQRRFLTDALRGLTCQVPQFVSLDLVSLVRDQGANQSPHQRLSRDA